MVLLSTLRCSPKKVKNSISTDNYFYITKPGSNKYIDITGHNPSRTVTYRILYLVTSVAMIWHIKVAVAKNRSKEKKALWGNADKNEGW